MIKEIDLCQHNLHIVDYCYIFKKYVERDFVDNFYALKLQEHKKDSTSRKLFLHYNILAICNYILKINKKGRIVLYFDYHNLLDCEVAEYIEESKLKDFFNHLYLKIKALLPIRVYYSTFSLEYLNTKFQKKDGQAIETLLKIKALSENSNFEKYTFEKCKKFIKKEGLTFLDTVYFNTLKSKQLLLV
jgi:hypothetical protein